METFPGEKIEIFGKTYVFFQTLGPWHEYLSNDDSKIHIPVKSSSNIHWIINQYTPFRFSDSSPSCKGLEDKLVKATLDHTKEVEKFSKDIVKNLT